MSDEKKLDEEHGVLLQELRVVLPGMQMLFAFLLTIPFSPGFAKVTPMERAAFVADLMATTLSSIFLIAPAMYHRLHWRRHVRDKDRMLRIINRLAMIGGIFLSIAIVTSVYLVIDFLLGGTVSAIATSVIAVTVLACWYALPLLGRNREGTPN